jgi:NADH-quinone oxidoreductase subunit J
VELFFFSLFSAAALVTALTVVIAKNPINSAIGLIGTFMSLAGIYVLLNAHFMAIIQVLVYAGAIMVLFLFVIMLLNLGDDELGERRVNFFKIAGTGIATILLGAFVYWFASPGVMAAGAWRVDNNAIDREWGGIVSVGESLFSDYLLPFEIASVLLLVAIIGALLMSKKRI